MLSGIRHKYPVRAPFRGQLNGNNPAFDPQFFTLAQNVYFDKTGCPVKRPGVFNLTSSSISSGHALLGIYEYVKQGTSGLPSTKKMYVINTYLIAENQASETASTANAVKSDLTADCIPDFAILQDKLYIANGSDVLQVYDQSTCADISDPPTSNLTGSFTPSIIETHQHCLWAAGIPGNPSRVYKSVALTGNDFDTGIATYTSDGLALVAAAGYLDVRPDDGTKITGLVGDHFGQLVIFKQESIHRVVGATKADYCMPPSGIINGIGAYKGTVVRAHNDIYFASRKGIHSLSTVEQYGDNKETYLSMPIQEYYDGLDHGEISKCASAHWPEYSMILWSLTLQGGDNNNIILAYNYDIKGWAIWTGLEITAMGGITEHGKKGIWVGDNDGKLNKFSFSMKDDYGEAYTAMLRGRVDCGDPMLNKGFRRFLVDFASISGTIDVRFRADNSAWTTAVSFTGDSYGAMLGTFILGTDVLGSGSSSSTKITDVNLHGKKLEFEISQDDADKDMAILGYSIEYLPQGYWGW